MVTGMKKLCLFFVLLVSGYFLGRAQSVAWNDPGTLGANEPAQLELVFTDCQPSGSVNLPTVRGLDVLGQPGRATSFSMINFQTSTSTTLSYSVRATAEGRIQIPAFTVATDKGRMNVPALGLNAGRSSSGQGRPQPNPGFPFSAGTSTPPPAAGNSIKGVAQAEAAMEPRNPYVGEVFDVNYRVFITGNRSGRVKTTPLWDVQNFTAEAWDRGQQIGPGGSKGLQFHTRAMIPKAGTFEVPPIRQKLDIETGFGGASFFFTQPGSQEVEVSSDPIPVAVQALPSGAPAAFKGAVGQFSMESKMVPEQVNEGEPVTWTLTLRGTGNWPMGVELPSRTVPNQIRTIQPKLRRDFNGTEVFTGAIVEDLVMIPTQSGEFELPPVKFVYFDPKKKTYESIEAKPPKISVTKGAGGLSLSSSVPTSTTTATPTAKQPIPQAVKPASPLQYGAPALPREPEEGWGRGFAPVGGGLLRLFCVLPWFLVLGAWWNWARRRAVMTDPERSRKEALVDWKRAVQTLRQPGENTTLRDKALLLWQKSVAGTFGVEGATPSWSDLSLVTVAIPEGDRGELAQCWGESEEVLYGRNRQLEEPWCDRAADLAARIDLPPLKFWEPLRPRNVFPWVALVLAVVVLSGGGLCAADNKKAEKTIDPSALYREGNFAEAAKIWDERVKKSPADPVARNNLALAYFQLGDKERALAHGLSSYLLAPGSGATAWNARIFSSAANQLDPAISRLWEEKWASALTSIGGVLVWQGAMLLGVVFLALGAGIWLAAGYGIGGRKILFRLGSVVLLVGAGLAIAGGSALATYGKLADRGAVMIVDVAPLRSVPTEVEPQAEKAYPPGSIAHLEKNFLGWSKIRLPNHDTGWIRTENLVPLY
jgi:tetratricopeptide (TPR) repeat protein